MKILEVIRNDEEVKQLRQKWEEKFTEPFPLWNYDCFGVIDDYKQRIRDALDSGNSKRICDNCAGKKCKAWGEAVAQKEEAIFNRLTVKKEEQQNNKI